MSTITRAGIDHASIGRRIAIAMALAAVVSAACSRSGAGSDRAPTHDAATPAPGDQGAHRSKVVSPVLFGANSPWNDLGNSILDRGEQIRDRSFRKAEVHWQAVNRGAARATFEPSGGAPVPEADTACAQLAVSAAESIAAVYQTVQGGVTDGEYSLRFKSRAREGSPALMIVVVDPSFAEVAAPSTETTSLGEWKQHAVKLRVRKSETQARVGLCAVSPGVVVVDDVRFSRVGDAPSVGVEARRAIRGLGVRSLRWPGGSDLDTLDWRQTVGPLSERREQDVIYGGPQTPSFGLHEFLDLCELEGLAPVIAVNVLDTPQSATDLLEYVRGDAETEQGRRRASHGRVKPWATATRFEIGNEPAVKYAVPGHLASGGRDYARRAKSIAEALRTKARALDCVIEVSGAFEGAMQLADWLGDRGESVVTLLDRWNAQCAEERLTDVVQAVHAHYYSYHGHVGDERRQFENLMAAGTVLRRTIEERIRPHSGGLPIWLTEYHALVSDDGVVQPSYSKDFESGLVVADILMTLIDEGVSVAQVHNLSEFGAFGLMFRDGSGWRVRPAGLAFRAISVAAGERTLDLRIAAEGNPEPVVVRRGVGNIPSRTTYQRIAGFATANATSGRPRVFLLNRSYDQSVTVQVEVPGVDLGSGVATWYRAEAVTADNEGDGDPKVALRTSEGIAGRTWRVELPPHSLVRIDSQ